MQLGKAYWVDVVQATADQDTCCHLALTKPPAGNEHALQGFPDGFALGKLVSTVDGSGNRSCRLRRRRRATLGTMDHDAHSELNATQS